MDPFYSSTSWKKLRAKVRARWMREGLPCGECGRALNWSDRPSCDHIVPRRTRRDLELVESNLQMTCRGCNTAKYNRQGAQVTRTGADGFPEGWGDR